MGIIDLGGGLNFVATSEPAALTNGAFAEGAVTPDRRAIVAPYAEHMAAWGQAFNFSIPSLTINSTAETPVLLIANPAGSGKVLKMSRLIFAPPGAATFVIFSNASSIVFKFYSTSVVSANGTAAAIVNGRQVGNLAASSSAYASPTITTKGSLFLTRTISSNTYQDLEHRFDFFKFVDPGNNLLVTAAASAAGISTAISGEFSEMLT